MRAVENLLDAWVGSRTGGLVIDPSQSRRCDPGEASGATRGETDGVTLDEGGTPASCGSVPASGDGVPVPGEDGPAPVDYAPAVVGDLASSRRLSA